jgi:hypothetical protein
MKGNVVKPLDDQGCPDRKEHLDQKVTRAFPVIMVSPVATDFQDPSGSLTLMVGEKLISFLVQLTIVVKIIDVVVKISLKNHSGLKGDKGRPGLPGLTGPKGDRGLPGPPASMQGSPSRRVKFFSQRFSSIRLTFLV